MEAPPAFVFHSANAYEDGSRVVVDCVCYQRMPDFEQVRTVCAAVLPDCEVGLHRICAASAVERSIIHNILWSTGVVLGDARRLAILYELIRGEQVSWFGDRKVRVGHSAGVRLGEELLQGR